MTATERALVRQIRDLQRRIVELERRHDNYRSTATYEIRRLEKQNVRLRALIKSHSTMHQQAVDQGRYWQGVAISNGGEYGE